MRRIFEDVELIASPTVGLTAPIIRYDDTRPAWEHLKTAYPSCCGPHITIVPIAQRLADMMLTLMAESDMYHCADMSKTKARFSRAQTAKQFLALMKSCLACSGHAAKIGESDLGLTGDLMRFTIPINMAGLPAITIPTGLSKEGELYKRHSWPTFFSLPWRSRLSHGNPLLETQSNQSSFFGWNSTIPAWLARANILLPSETSMALHCTIIQKPAEVHALKRKAG